ncbi:MAG TPA: DUF3108 domain-containing protein [Ramlibacter sp.]|nr:DUF3108 domain-containing protein [Ramlibacter sp.]
MNDAAPWRPLATLTVAVFAAHVTLLRSGNFQLQMPDPLATRTLVTRTIHLAPADVHPDAPAPRPPRELRRGALHAMPVIADTRSSPVAPPARSVESPVAADHAPPPAPAEAAAPPRESPVASVAIAIPGSARYHYKVMASRRGQMLEARGELHWRHDGASYEAMLQVSAPLFPSRTQRSSGQITGDGLAPTRFSDTSRSEQATHFEREKGKIVFSNNQPEATLLAGAQDRLSVVLQLSTLVGGAPARFRPGSAITIQTADVRAAESWVFTVEGEESLQLPGGTQPALKLTRNPRKEFDQKVELWLAPGMDYVPVRLRLTQPNGDWVDQQWSGTDRP